MHVGLATGFAYQGRESGSDADFVREEIDRVLRPARVVISQEAPEA